ncbi:biotin/lipoyl-binding protein [Paenibacillus sp. S3N08]|uniref:Biotin/lipoyl-binding protein n=1 Tax=Paenibacillus agricola TaxID=2716264 RepID=A0ABX0JBX9_9BACL|nr:biotin/lipoyl-binding protein [Paenibacillus agricola]
MKKSIIAACVLVLSLGAGGVLLAVEGKDAVTIATEQKVALLSAEQVNVSFQSVSGKLVQVYVIEENQVKKGDKIAELDQTDIDLQIAKTQLDIETTELKIKQTLQTNGSADEKSQNGVLQAQIALNQAITSRDQLLKGARTEDIEKQKLAVQAAQASIDYAQKMHNQLLNQYDKPNDMAAQTAKQERDQLELSKSQLTNLNNGLQQQQIALEKMLAGPITEEKQQAEWSIEKAQAVLEQTIIAKNDQESQSYNAEALTKQLEQQKIQLQAYQLQKDRMTLTAPADGKISKVTFKAGENVSAGTPIALLHTGQLYYDIYIDETQLQGLAVGGEVPTSIISTNKEVKGTVRFINSAPQFASLRMSRDRGLSDLSTFQIRIYLESNDSLLPGMSAEVKLDAFISK